MPDPRPLLEISTTAEAAESAALPRRHEVHSDPEKQPLALPEGLHADPPKAKSPARWAYERLVLYIRNFEAQLDPGEEVALAFTGGEVGVIRIEGMGYFDPDIITFYGSDPTGAKTQIIQHVARLSVLLRAMPRSAAAGEEAGESIGFRLVRDLESGGPPGDGGPGSDGAGGPVGQDEAGTP